MREVFYQREEKPKTGRRKVGCEVTLPKDREAPGGRCYPVYMCRSGGGPGTLPHLAGSKRKGIRWGRITPAIRRQKNCHRDVLDVKSVFLRHRFRSRSEFDKHFQKKIVLRARVVPTIEWWCYWTALLCKGDLLWRAGRSICLGWSNSSCR